MPASAGFFPAGNSPRRARRFDLDRPPGGSYPASVKGERNGKIGRERQDMNQDTREKGKAIEAAVGQIEKQFGKGAIMKLGSRETVEVPAISTGALSIDWALGVGGIPRGRVVEIFGPESSG